MCWQCYAAGELLYGFSYRHRILVKSVPQFVYPYKDGFGNSGYIMKWLFSGSRMHISRTIFMQSSRDSLSMWKNVKCDN